MADFKSINALWLTHTPTVRPISEFIVNNVVDSLTENSKAILTVSPITMYRYTGIGEAMPIDVWRSIWWSVT